MYIYEHISFDVCTPEKTDLPKLSISWQRNCAPPHVYSSYTKYIFDPEQQLLRYHRIAPNK